MIIGVIPRPLLIDRMSSAGQYRTESLTRKTAYKSHSSLEILGDGCMFYQKLGIKILVVKLYQF